MEEVEFVVPLTPEGLLKAATRGGRYTVTHPLDAATLSDKDISRTLDRMSSRLEAKPTDVREHEVFDTLHALLSKHAALSCSSKLQLADLLGHGAARLNERAAVLLQSSAEAYRSEAAAYRNAFKMYVYLLFWYISCAEKQSQKQEKAAAAKGKKGKKAAAGDGSWSSVTQKENLLCTLVHVLEVDLRKLWNNGTPEEEFMNLFVKIALQFCESAANVKSKQLRECIFALLSTLVVRYQLTFAVSSALIELVFKHEHFVAPAAELVEKIANDHPQFAGDVVTELSRMDSNFADAAGTKNIAQFMQALAERVPRQLLPFVSLLIPYLGNDAYVLRNGVVQALGQIVAHGFSGEEGGEERTAGRERLLEILEDRLLDVASYTRSKALQTWLYLVGQKAVPLSFLPRLLSATIGRLEDRTAQVRRYAVQLLTGLVHYNPFSLNGTLRLSEFEEQLSRARAALAATKRSEDELAGKAGEESPRAEAAEGEPKEGTDSQVEGQADVSSQEEALLLKAQEEADNASEDEDEMKTPEQERLEKAIAFYRDAAAFVFAVHTAVPMVIKLLASSTVTDIQESVRFLVTANEFKIEAAEDGAKKMLVLVWSKDAATKEAVVDAYRQLYLTPPRQEKQQLEDLYVASNLVKLATSLSTTEMTSFEELVTIMTAKDYISDDTVEHLWSFFARKFPNSTAEHSKGALIVLSMVANARPQTVQENLNLLVSLGLGVRWRQDEEVARFACIALQKLARQSATGLRLPSSHALVQQLAALLRTPSSSPRRWFPAAEQAANALYALADRPDAVCGEAVHHWANRLFGPEAVPSSVSSSHDLARLLFLAGHVAMKQMQHLEDVQAELQRRKVAADAAKARPGLEEELGLQATDDTEELVQCVTEQHLVGDNLLGRFSGLIVAVCKNEQGQFSDPILRSAAVVALCKYMCVSSRFCEEHLRLLFTLLERAPEAWVRSDIVIALGDLASRFPNQVGAWTPKIYARLRDSEASVRKNTLMVLSHLILNEMVRVKGQISEIAICIVDEDRRIADLARLFFSELNSKGNCLYSIYNILPDMISNLTGDGVSSEVFRRLMRYLFAFIDKEKQIESLVDRLCKQRLKGATDAGHAADIAYCLSLLNYSDKGFRKIAANFKCYADQLVHEPVYNAFLTILQKCRKGKATREDVDDLEARVRAAHTGEAAPEEGTAAETSAAEAEESGEETETPQKKRTQRKARVVAAKRRPTRARRGRRAAAAHSDDEEAEAWEASDDEE